MLQPCVLDCDIKWIRVGKNENSRSLSILTILAMVFLRLFEKWPSHSLLGIERRRNSWKKGLEGRVEKLLFS